MAVTLFTYRHRSKSSTEAIVDFLGLNVKIIYVEDICGGDLSSKALGLDASFQNIGSEESKTYERLFEPIERLLPALYDDAVNTKLNQTIVVNRYLIGLAHNTRALLGDNPAYHYEILMWTSRILRSVETEAQPFVRRTLGCAKSLMEVTLTIENTFRYLEDHLRRNTYLVGEGVTLADIENAPVVLNTFRECFGIRCNYPAIFRWIYTSMSSQVFDMESSIRKWKGDYFDTKESMRDDVSVYQGDTHGWSKSMIVAYTVLLDSPVLIVSRYNVLNMYPLAALQGLKQPRFTYIASGEILEIGLVPASPNLNHPDYISVRVCSDNEYGTFYVLKYCLNGFEILAHFDDMTYGKLKFYPTNNDNDVDRFGVISEGQVSKYDFSQTRGVLEPRDMGDELSCDNDGFFPLSESWILYQTCDCYGGSSAEIYNYHHDKMKYICDFNVSMKIRDFCTIPGYKSRFLLCCSSAGFIIDLDEELNDDDVKIILEAPYIGGYIHLPEMSEENLEFFSDGIHISSINHEMEWVVYDADIGSALRLGNKYFEKDGVISVLEKTESENLEAACFFPDGSTKKRTIYTNGYALKEIGSTYSLQFI